MPSLPQEHGSRWLERDQETGDQVADTRFLG